MTKRQLKHHIYTGIIHEVLFFTSHKYISYIIAKFFVINNGLLRNSVFFNLRLQGATIILLMEA